MPLFTDQHHLSNYFLPATHLEGIVRKPIKSSMRSSHFSIKFLVFFFSLILANDIENVPQNTKLRSLVTFLSFL